MSDVETEISDEEAAELNESLGADVDEPADEETADVTELEAALGDEQIRQAKATSEREMEKAIAKLTAEGERHANRIREIMGDDADGLVPCELCLPITPGFRWDRSPDEPTVAAVRVAIGMPDLSNYADSVTERQCPDCHGLGKVRTGSSVPKYETATCDACGGKGFAETRKREHPQTIEDILTPQTNGEQVFEDDGIKRDMFGTPETDPDYNLMPGARARPTDYWQTHRV